jgi:hypothetical protein
LAKKAMRIRFVMESRSRFASIAAAKISPTSYRNDISVAGCVALQDVAGLLSARTRISDDSMMGSDLE